MNHELLPAIDRYFSAVAAGDPPAAAAAFAEDGIVRDEGADHRGRAAIAGWIAEAQRRYRFTNEVLGAREAAGAVIVDVRVSGDFPGSPAVLAHRFRLDGANIQSLEIAP